MQIPIQSAITGEEDISDLSKPVHALTEFYRAFNRRDLSLMQQNWDNSDDTAMDNPLGGIRRSWGEIRAVYERIFHSDARVSVEFFDYTLLTVGDICIAVGRERGRLESKDVALNLAIRTTRIFRRSGPGRWKQINHHGSIDDPRLLAAYQAAVR
jgi:ketosteroid isomerase-like protein